MLIDDFLANGKALEGLAALVRDSGAELVGAGIVIETSDNSTFAYPAVRRINSLLFHNKFISHTYK